MAINVATMPNARVSTSLKSILEGDGTMAGVSLDEGSTAVDGQPPVVPGYFGISMLRYACTGTKASLRNGSFECDSFIYGQAT